MADIVVHHLQYSRSVRVLWMLEEMGVEYAITTYQRDKNFRAPPELAQVHPLGRAPVVCWDDRVLAESGAILEFLADQHPALRPEPGTPQHQDYRFWLHYAEGSLLPPLLVRLIIGRIRTAPVPFFIKPIARGIADKVDENYTNPQLQLHLRYIDQHLADNRYFVGSTFTAADIQMVYGVEGALSRGGVDRLPNMQAWLNRVSERPAYQRALQKGGPAMPEES